MKALLPLVVLATGCVDRVQPYDPDVELTFSPFFNVNVRSLPMASGDVTVKNPENSVPFGVNAWCGDGLETFLSAEKVEKVADCWKTEDVVMWPEREKKLTVLAWSPYDACPGADLQTGVVFRDVNVLKDNLPDYLYADPVTELDKLNTGGTVNLPFSNALSSIEFKIKNRVGNDEEIIIESIELQDFLHKGDFRSLPQPVWTPEGEPVCVSFFEGEFETEHIAAPIGDRRMLIPQTLDAPVLVKFRYIHSSGTHISQTLFSENNLRLTMLPGRHYAITLSIGVDTVNFLLDIINIENERL